MGQNVVLASEVAEQQQAEQDNEKSARDAEIDFCMNDPFLCEDTSVALAGNGRIRRDHFKGFSKDQTMTFYQENEKMIQAKQAAKGAEDLEWAAHQAHVRQMMDTEDAALKSQLQERNVAHHKLLVDQMREEQKKENENERFGKLEDAFFENFGTSHR